MKNISKYFIMILALSGGILSACSDWTDTESVDIKNPTIQDQNPELYAKYLANLREYRTVDHKTMYVTFQNVAAPVSRGHRIVSIPDSVDVISLERHDNLSAVELKDIEEVRLRGTKVVYTIDYLTIESSYKIDKAAHNAIEDAKPEGEEKQPYMSFDDYIPMYMDANFAFCNKYNYDGVVIAYEGKSTMNMTDSQLAEYKITQSRLFDKVTEWKNANTNKMLVFQGQPQNLLNKTILTDCAYIIIPTQYSQSIGAVETSVIMAMRADVPRKNILVAVRTFSLDKADLATGYFGKSSAIIETAYWVGVRHQSFDKGGIAILGVQNDYYNPNAIYTNCRLAIEIMNPAPKN